MASGGKAAEIRAGRSEDPMQLCLPPGTPRDMLSPGPFMIAQTPAKITMLHQHRHLIRHVYLDVPHSKTVKPSWYGESVGRYEGDTLVVDTIGLNTKTFVDNFRTPHTEKLHVVERWKLIEDGKTLEVTFTVDDPDTYEKPWSAKQRFRKAQGPMIDGKVEPLEREARDGSGGGRPPHRRAEP